MKIKFIRFILRLLWVIWRNWPRRLPIGMTAFNKFAAGFFALYPDIPDNDSTRRSLAMMIQLLPPDQCKTTYSHFAKATYKVMANEVAFHVIDGIRAKEKAAEKERLSKAADGVVPEATADGVSGD